MSSKGKIKQKKNKRKDPADMSIAKDSLEPEAEIVSDGLIDVRTRFVPSAHHRQLDLQCDAIPPGVEVFRVRLPFDCPLSAGRAEVSVRQDGSESLKLETQQGTFVQLPGSLHSSFPPLYAVVRSTASDTQLREVKLNASLAEEEFVKRLPTGTTKVDSSSAAATPSQPQPSQQSRKHEKREKKRKHSKKEENTQETTLKTDVHKEGGKAKTSQEHHTDTGHTVDHMSSVSRLEEGPHTSSLRLEGSPANTLAEALGRAAQEEAAAKDNRQEADGAKKAKEKKKKKRKDRGEEQG